MIHTATDIVATAPGNRHDGAVQPTPGPDFVTGWGLINAERAVGVVRNRRLVEDAISHTCHVLTYSFDVPPAAAEPVRVTLARDDVASNSKLAMTPPRTAPLLVNDLDLVLIDPNGKPYYPWQLDQTILSTGKKPRPLADSEQLCGRGIVVQRHFRA
jgi:hypothetical protein